MNILKTSRMGSTLYNEISADINFGQLIEVVIHTPETVENQAILKKALLTYQQGKGLSHRIIATTADFDRITYYQNLAAFFAWNGQFVFLDMVLATTPSLMWQRNRPDVKGMFLVTPLDAVAHSRNLCSLEIVLNHPILTDYAKSQPAEYALLVDQTLTRCKRWFAVTMNTIESAIIQRLQFAWADNLIY